MRTSGLWAKSRLTRCLYCGAMFTPDESAMLRFARAAQDGLWCSKKCKGAHRRYDTMIAHATEPISNIHFLRPGHPLRKDDYPSALITDDGALPWLDGPWRVESRHGGFYIVCRSGEAGVMLVAIESRSTRDCIRLADRLNVVEVVRAHGLEA